MGLQGFRGSRLNQFLGSLGQFAQIPASHSHDEPRLPGSWRLQLMKKLRKMSTKNLRKAIFLTKF